MLVYSMFILSDKGAKQFFTASFLTQILDEELHIQILPDLVPNVDSSQTRYPADFNEISVVFLIFHKRRRQGRLLGGPPGGPTVLAAKSGRPSCPGNGAAIAEPPPDFGFLRD